MENPNRQTPATVNQISQERPNIDRSFATLEGNIAGSFNAGHNRTIAFFRVMQGQQIEEYWQNLKIKLLTPLTPAYQTLRMCVTSYFVPDKRVYEGSEEFVSQAGGSTQPKIKEKPNLKGKRIPFVQGMTITDRISITETTAWRDTFISDYMPRVGYFEHYDISVSSWVNSGAQLFVDQDATLLRGRIAIYNDYERHKGYESQRPEYKGNTVSDAEWASYLPTTEENFSNNSMRARRNNSYYTDYRTEIQGFDTAIDDVFQDYGPSEMLLKWQQVEQLTAEVRAQANNEEKNPWEVLHELYGTKRKLTEGKVQILGRYTFPLNYSSITQNTYNNGDVRPEFQVMGQQGAYSFTEITVPCFAGFEAIEGGWVHVIATVTADSVFERCFDRTTMNVAWDSEYRPDLKNEKLDILHMLEVENSIQFENGMIGWQQTPIGFKRRWSEYYKLPNRIQGDMCTANVMQAIWDANGNIKQNGTEVIGQQTHQLYEETAAGTQVINNGPEFVKRYWKDYTDLLLNKNQAIMNDVRVVGTDNEIQIDGQNQIFFSGKHYCRTRLPMPEEIKANFSKWGEH